MFDEAWEAGDTGERGLDAVWKRFRCMSGSMQRWAREVFGSIRRSINKLKHQLVDAKRRALDSGSSPEVRELEEQLKEICTREEIMYKQRSRVEWLTAGDQNTKYFQNRATHRKRKNTVKALRREDGTRCTNDEQMREMAAHFYEALFSSEGSILHNKLGLFSSNVNILVCPHGVSLALLLVNCTYCSCTY